MNSSMWRTGLAAAACFLALVTSSATAGADEAPTYGYRVVSVFPHDPNAFTQGLVYSDGDLYESVGNYGQSGVRQVDLETGQVKQQRAMQPRFFGEGLTLWQDQLIQLTWRERLGIVRDRGDLRAEGTFPLAPEGWGITQDGTSWILSDGSADLRFMDPASKAFRRTVTVKDGDRPIARLNELEYIKGEIWANIWKSDLIVRIAPESGKVLGYVDLTDLWPRAERPGREAVLNGIAYDAEHDRLFVTGKYWPRLYEIKLTARAKGSGGSKPTGN